MRVTCVVTVRAKPGQADALMGILQQGRDFALGVDGCVGFEVYQAKEDPTRLVLLEHWESEEQHQEHFQTNVVDSGVLERAEALMEEPFPPPAETYHLQG